MIFIVKIILPLSGFTEIRFFNFFVSPKREEGGGSNKKQLHQNLKKCTISIVINQFIKSVLTIYKYIHSKNCGETDFEFEIRIRSNGIVKGKNARKLFEGSRRELHLYFQNAR